MISGDGPERSRVCFQAAPAPPRPRARGTSSATAADEELEYRKHGIPLTSIYVGADIGEIWGTDYRMVVLTEEHLSEDGDGIEGVELSDDMDVGDTVWIVGDDWTASDLVHIDVTQRELYNMDAPRHLAGYYERVVPLHGRHGLNSVRTNHFTIKSLKINANTYIYTYNYVIFT